MYEKILIPVALEETQSLDRVLETAKALGGANTTYHIAHVIVDIPAEVMSYIPEDILAENRKQIHTDLRVVAAQFETSKAVVLHGKAGPRLVEFIKENAVDCVVMASHIPALSDVIFGSSAAHIVRHAPCSVFVAR